MLHIYVCGWSLLYLWQGKIVNGGEIKSEANVLLFSRYVFSIREYYYWQSILQPFFVCAVNMKHILCNGDCLLVFLLHCLLGASLQIFFFFPQIHKVQVILYTCNAEMLLVQLPATICFK